MLKQILELFKKPITTVTDFSNKEDIKTGVIKTAIVSAIFMLISIFTAMKSAVSVTSFSKQLSGKSTLEWSNLGKVPYLSLIFKNFAIFFAIIIAVAALFYVISRLLKKDLSFTKTLSIAANSFIIYIAGTILGFIVSLLSAEFGMFIMLAFAIYALFTLFICFRDLLNIEDSNSYTLITTICLTVLIVIAYFILKNYVLSEIEKSLGNFLLK